MEAMYKYRFGDKVSLAFMSVSMMVRAGVSGLFLLALKYITDYAVEGQVSKLIEISKLLLIVIIFELIFSLLTSYLQSTYMNKSMKNIRQAYVRKLFDLDIKNLSTTDEEKYLSQLSNDIDRYEDRFYLKLIELINTGAQLMVSMIILATVNNTLLFLALGLLVFFIVISKRTSKPVAEKEKVKSKSLQKYTNYISETLQGFFVIKQNQLEKSRIGEFKNLAGQVQKDNYEVDKKSTHVDAFNSFIQMLIIFTLVFLGLYSAKKYGLSVGTTLLAGTAFAQSIWPMQSITPYISQMTGISAVLDEFEEILNQKASEAREEIGKISKINFTRADLGYEDMTVLENVNLDIKENQKVLIVGVSGAGKSTILKSIRRQLPLKSGIIRVNGYDIEDIKAHSYYKELSVIDQIGFIFNGSLKDNISLYKDNNLPLLKDILKKVGLEDLDLDHRLKNNGSNISGGQRARLLLGRALYLDTSLIICDEIFANLDRKIGSDIEKQILSLEKTIINVSHIIYDENLKLYDSIYRVKDGGVEKIKDLKEFNDLGLFLKEEKNEKNT